MIPARNEQTNLYKTLLSLFEQTVKPSQVVLVNDNSIDNTREVGQSFGCNVIDYPFNHKENWVGSFKLAAILNEGFKALDSDLDYIMILGADHILPKNYIEKITDRMNVSDSIVIASGMILGEWSTTPRGSGRIIKAHYWKKIGSCYPMNYGYEGYALYKALSLGYEIKYYSDIHTTTQRKTGNTYKPSMSYNYGKAMQALGYTSSYALGRCFVNTKRKGLKHGIAMLKGYRSNHVTPYEKELVDFVKESHKLNRSHIKRLFTYLVKS